MSNIAANTRSGLKRLASSWAAIVRRSASIAMSTWNQCGVAMKTASGRSASSMAGYSR